VSVAFDMNHAMRTRRIVMCGLPGYAAFFYIIS